MVYPIMNQLQALGESCSRAVTSLVWGQWLMVNTGMQTTQAILGRAAPIAGKTPASETGGVVAPGGGTHE
jgi:hypothetical protein